MVIYWGDISDSAAAAATMAIAIITTQFIIIGWPSIKSYEPCVCILVDTL